MSVWSAGGKRPTPWQFREAREAKGLSLAHMEGETTIDAARLEDIEDGLGEPVTRWEVDRISWATGCRWNYFLLPERTDREHSWMLKGVGYQTAYPHFATVGRYALAERMLTIAGGARLHECAACGRHILEREASRVTRYEERGPRALIVCTRHTVSQLERACDLGWGEAMGAKPMRG